MRRCLRWAWVSMWVANSIPVLQMGKSTIVVRVKERSPQWTSRAGVPVVVRVRVDSNQLPAWLYRLMAARLGGWAKRSPMTRSWVWVVAMGS